MERYTTADGWPGVRWDQEVPTGESWYTRFQLVQQVAALVLGAGLMAWLWSSGVEFGWAAFWGVVVAFAIMAPEAFNRIGASLEGKGGSGPGKSDWERDWTARWKASPLFRRQHCSAEMSLDHSTKSFMFRLKSNGEEVTEFPLEGFTSFELGTTEEWFGDAAARDLERLGHQPGSWVIVAGVMDRGVVRIAQSGRDKAGITNLLLVLSDEFISKRKALMGRVA